jgi:FkbH-like protein
MNLSDAQLDKLLGASSAQEIKNHLMLRNAVPSLPQSKKLLAHLSSITESPRSLRLGIVHTYTSELLDPWLEFSGALNGLAMDIYHAPYGVTIPEAQESSGLARHQPDITLLLLQKSDLHPALSLPTATLPAEELSSAREQAVSSAAGLVKKFRGTVNGQIIIGLLPTLDDPSLGLYDGQAQNGEQQWWSRLKSELAETLRTDFSGVTLLDMDQLVTRVGRNQFFDRRLWYSSVFPFSSEGALALCNAISDIAASLTATRAKVIVLDADNTMWGGVIGEDGMQGIALGQDYPGNNYVDFQKRILGFQQRGFILALCSKNNPEDLNEVLERHPQQLLKHEHFAAERVNWLPKPDNIKSIAEELNLGLDSFIFVDDSDYECAAVRHALPEVEVIQVPAKPMDVPTCLDSVARLQITSLTSEDLQKTAMYAQERQRKSQLDDLAADGGSIDDYLRSLNMKMRVSLDDDSVLPRLSQLTQKTNQFNLTTRRYSESEVAQKIVDANTAVFHFSLADNFGDSGIVGLAIVERQDEGRAHLDTFLMSCRVIGRRAEETFLRTIIRELKDINVKELTAEYIPTRKNVLVETFLPDHGFIETDSGAYMTNLSDETHNLGDDLPIDIEGPGQQ